METTPMLHPRVIYVEDEAFFAGTMAKLLNDSGYPTLTTSDGESGFDIIKKYKPELVLLDLVLPKVDGQELVRKIKNDPETSKISVIVLSNLSGDATQSDLHKIGVDGFFVKAFTLPSVIVAEIQRRLGPPTTRPTQ